MISIQIPQSKSQNSSISKFINLKTNSSLEYTHDKKKSRIIQLCASKQARSNPHYPKQCSPQRPKKKKRKKSQPLYQAMTARASIKNSSVLAAARRTRGRGGSSSSRDQAERGGRGSACAGTRELMVAIAPRPQHVLSREIQTAPRAMPATLAPATPVWVPIMEFF